MIGISGANELVVGRVHQIEQTTDHPGHIIHKRLGVFPGRFGFFFDLLTVFIGAGHEEDVVTFLTFTARDRIRENDLVDVADVRLTGGVGNGCCQIIVLVGFHIFSF